MVEVGELVPPAPHPCFFYGPASYSNSTLTIWPNMGQEERTKISFFKLSSELSMKIWKCNLDFSKIPIYHLFYELGKAWEIQMLNLWMS